MGLYEANEKHISDDMLEGEKKILSHLEKKFGLKNSYLISMKVKSEGDSPDARD